MKLFQIMMSNLIYLIYFIRLNIEYSIQCLFRFNINSFKKVFEIVKKILRYFKEIKKIVITYELDKNFDDFIDVNSIDDVSTRRFIDVYLFLLYENAIN